MSKTPLPDRLPGRVDEPIGNRLQTARPAHNTEVDSPPLTTFKSVSDRIGPRGLIHLARDLSERDQEILHAVSEHRFLTARHVERLVFTDHASDTTATFSASRNSEYSCGLPAALGEQEPDRRPTSTQSGQWAIGC